MRLLTKDEEADESVEVTWEDQQQINTFSKLNNRQRDMEESIERLKQEKEALSDLASELELADEDDTVMYQIGETFVHLKLPDAQERISKDQEQLDRDMEEIQERFDACGAEMKELKIALYGKFGKAINLD